MSEKQKLRIDVVGSNEFSQHVGVYTDQVVSSIKVNLNDKSVTVFYRRKEDGKPLQLAEDNDELVEVESEVSRKTELLNEVATPDSPAPLLGVVTPEEEKMDAHVGGDTVADSGVTGDSEPNVVISGGTPTVDGKKVTRSRKA